MVRGRNRPATSPDQKRRDHLATRSRRSPNKRRQGHRRKDEGQGGDGGRKRNPRAAAGSGATTRATPAGGVSRRANQRALTQQRTGGPLSHAALRPTLAVTGKEGSRRMQLQENWTRIHRVPHCACGKTSGNGPASEGST